MIYLDYEKCRQNYLEAQRRYDEILSEKEKLFALTQPKAVRFDKEPCVGGNKGSPFDSYLIEKERRRIDERLEEAKILLSERKELLMQKGQDLKKSTDCHDRIYRMKYIEGLRVIKIASVLGYDKSSVYRILRVISDNIRNKIEVATK